MTNRAPISSSVKSITALAKNGKDTGAFFVQAIGGGDHTSVGSPEGHASSQDGQDCGLGDDQHVGAKCACDGDVVEKLEASSNDFWILKE